MTDYEFVGQLQMWTERDPVPLGESAKPEKPESEVIGQGSQRYRDRRADGTVDRAIALPYAPEDNDEAAYLAEELFGSRYGLHASRERKVDKGDFVSSTGVTIDVKWTPLLRGRLVSRVGSPVYRVYVLVVGPVGSMRVVGWIWGSLHRDPASLRDLGHGMSYVTDQTDLRTDVDLMMEKLFGLAPVGRVEEL